MRWRIWAASAALAIAGIAITVFNIGEWVELQRQRVQSHPLPDGRIPWELAIDDGARIAIVVVSTLFALVASVPALVIVAWLTRRAGRYPAEAILAAGLTWPVFGIVASRAEEVLATLLGLGGQSDAFDILVPPTEELLLLGCAAAVLLMRRPHGMRPAIALGLATGIGMNVWETALYVQAAGIFSGLGGEQVGEWSTIGVRAALLGFGLHAVTAALSTLGLAVSLARPPGRGRFVPAVLALGASVVIHGAWNATATPLFNGLIRAMAGPDGIRSPLTAFVAGSIVAVPFLVGPAAVLVVAWRRAGRAGEPSGTPAAPVVGQALAGDSG